MKSDLYSVLFNYLDEMYQECDGDVYDLFKDVAQELILDHCVIYDQYFLGDFNIEPEYVKILTDSDEEDEYDDEEYSAELYEGYDKDAITYIKDVLMHGCKNGACSRLIYYSQTHEFFNKHVDAILEIYDEECRELDLTGAFELTRNNLAWFAYEYVLRSFMYKLDPEW